MADVGSRGRTYNGSFPLVAGGTRPVSDAYPPDPDLSTGGVNAGWYRRSKPVMPNGTIMTEEFNALIAERNTAITERDSIIGRLRSATVERECKSLDRSLRPGGLK